MSGRRFGFLAGLLIAGFVVVVFGVPICLFVLDRLWGEEDVQFVDAIRITTATFIAPLFYLTFVMSMIWPCWRRTKTLGLSGTLSLFVIILMLADLTFFIAGSGGGAFGPSIGSFQQRVPVALMTALGIVAALATAKSPQADGERLHFGPVGVAAVVLACLIIIQLGYIVGAMVVLRMLDNAVQAEQSFSPIWIRIVLASYWPAVSIPAVSVVLLGCLARCVALSHRASKTPEP